jgi:hypothetical protein
MESWNKPEIIDECLSHIEEDFMPLNDVFRSIYGFNIQEINHEQLKNTLELISFLLKNKDVITVFGPEMKPSGNSINTDIERIEKTLEAKDYDDYNYGIWFDLAEHWKK